MKMKCLFALAFVIGASIFSSAQELSARASQALFVDSDSTLALQLAEVALKHDRHDAEAAFVAMEASAMRADDAGTLDAALLVAGELDPSDPRAELAVARIESLAENSATFRARIPRVKKLAQTIPELRLALVSAASDGAAELNQLISSRDSGLVTDWRVAGPFGRNSLIDFDKSYPPERDLLLNRRSGRHAVEQLQFANGRFTLPDYFSHRGVFYAGSDVYLASDGMWNVFLETAGTAEVFIDGKRVCLRDERRSAQPEMLRVVQHLKEGHHKLLVKFTPSASPFRLAIMSPTGSNRRKQSIPVLTASPESEYATASLELFRGDTAHAFADARRLVQHHESAIAHWLVARCWQSISEDATEQEPELRSSVALDGDASAVKLALAEQLFRADRKKQGLALLKELSASAPHNEGVLRTEAVQFFRLDWRHEAEQAYEDLLAEHPSCSNLRSAAAFYAATEDVSRAAEIEQSLGNCAPGSLDLAYAYARRGEHTRAAQAAMKVASLNPLDRAPLQLAVRQWMMTGDAQAAYPVAQHLAEIAPSSAQYQGWVRLLASGQTVEDDVQGAPLELIAPYRRNSFEVIRQTAARKFSGGPAIWPLNDAVLANIDGTWWLYTHRIVRLLDRDGVLNYSEVAVPSGAEVLNLRTISASGAVSEPEFNQHKATVSMTALAPGDCIEEEFIQKLQSGGTRFEFGSWDAPILLSRFTLIAAPEIHADNNSPLTAKVQQLADGLTASTWELNDIAQSTREVGVPRGMHFASVYVPGDLGTPAQLRENAQEQLLSASVPGHRAMAVAASLASTDPHQRARNIYRFVMHSVDDDGSDELRTDITTAEDSLGSGEGSRAATLLALSRAAGLSAELLLARRMGSSTEADEFTHPVAVFHFTDGTSIAADLGDDALPIGSLNPMLHTDSALPVIAFAGDSPSLPTTDSEHLPVSSADEESTATANVNVDSRGTLTAAITIRMAPWRGAQMRNVLRGVSAPDRQRFFQQLAMRIFPGAAESNGTVTNENDPDQPLILQVNCSAPRFLDLHHRYNDIDQLAPALGLRSMYARPANRVFPLLIDSVLFESTMFRVTLPPGVTFTRGMQADIESPFGEYSTSVRQVESRTWEMRRDFHIPVQVIPPSQYGAFSAFAARIDAIERQRLSLHSQPVPVQSARLQRSTH